MMDVQRENYKKYGNLNGVSQESESSHLLSSNFYKNTRILGRATPIFYLIMNIFSYHTL